jgi:uncharacterized protein YukE
VVTSFSDSLPATNQEALDTAAGPWQAPNPVPPPPDFTAPKLHVAAVASQPAVGSGFWVETPQLTNVAGAMGSDQSTAQAGLNTLNNEGPLASLVSSGWDVSDAVGTNAENAYYGISALTTKLLSSYEDMSTFLRKAATGYNDADDNAAGAARSIGA